jgi:predicted RNA polymerase sigma factor
MTNLMSDSAAHRAAARETIQAEAAGLVCMADAIDGALGAAFVAAVEAWPRRRGGRSSPAWARAAISRAGSDKRRLTTPGSEMSIAYAFLALSLVATGE